MNKLHNDMELSDEEKEKVFKKPELVGRCSYIKCGIKILADESF